MTQPASPPNGLAGGSGFTYLELLVVMAVIGIVAAMGLPAMLASLEVSQLNAAGVEVQAALTFAQREAVSQHRSTRVVANLTAHTITVQQLRPAVWSASSSSLDQALVETNTYQTAPDPLSPGQSYQLLYDGASSNGITLASASFASSTTVSFDPYGQPSATGSVVLTGPRRTLHINLAATGQVTRN